MAGGKDACELARGLPRNGRLRAAGDGGQQHERRRSRAAMTSAKRKTVNGCAPVGIERDALPSANRCFTRQPSPGKVVKTYMPHPVIK